MNITSYQFADLNKMFSNCHKDIRAFDFLNSCNDRSSVINALPATAVQYVKQEVKVI